MYQNTIFFHGWGYDKNFWRRHIEQHKFKYENSLISLYDRGYGYQAHKPALIKGKNICITHSMGLFFAAQEYDLRLFDYIIIYGGFERFSNIAYLKAMRLGMRRDPITVLKSFYQLCGYIPDDYPMDYALLQQDLLLLEQFDLRELDYWPNIPYEAYHGDKDNIVNSKIKKSIILSDSNHLCNLFK